METTDWSFYAAGIAAVLVGLSCGGFFFGMLVHESSHAIVCLLFGLPYSWSWSQVVYVRSPNPLVNNSVGLAGGMAQALFSLLFFWYFITLEKKVLVQSLLNEGRSPKRSILLGFELAFLTIAFHGVINGIWEGLFYQSYERIHGNLLVWGTIILLCGIISFYILYKRQSLFLKQMRAHMWALLLELASWGRRFRGDFIAGAIAFLILFLIGWVIQGLANIATLLSLSGLIIVLVPLLLSNESCFGFLLQRFIMAKFQYPIKIGVLDGYLSKDRVGKLPGRPFTEYEPLDWYNAFSSKSEFKVDWISAAEISSKYNIVINPFGEMYPEIDKPNLLTLRKIVDYVQNGGVFVNVAGLAFFYLWDGDKEDLTGPLYETYQISKIPGLLERKILLRVSHLLDSWLYKQFGIRTTFFDPSIVNVHPISDEYFKDLDKVGNQTKVLEFRSAFRSEKDKATLIPLLKTEYKIKVREEEEIPFECYPIAAVKYGRGYLILNGMKLEKSRPQDFEKAVEAIRCIVKKLNSKGTL